jgi:hypothetical protein
MAEEVTPDPASELKAMQDALKALSPLEAGARQRAVTWLAGALGVATTEGSGIDDGGLNAGGQGGAEGPTLPSNQPGELGTPRQFLAAKRPTTDVERVTCLAYYMTNVTKKPHFKTRELIELNTEAAGIKISNPSQATANAKDRNGYLAEAGGGNRQITPLGEAVVAAMPDRDAVAKAIADGPKKVRRKPGPKKKSDKNAK